eukprot:7381649-Prymnesium_polylepis.2
MSSEAHPWQHTRWGRAQSILGAAGHPSALTWRLPNLARGTHGATCLLDEGGSARSIRSNRGNGCRAKGDAGPVVPVSGRSPPNCEMTTPPRVSWTNVDTGTPEPVAVTASNSTNQAL